MNDYAEFIDAKTHAGADTGFEPLSLPKQMFGFQEALTTWALRKGRAALYQDCGTGKTLEQLAWADNVARKTNRHVLILTPLAVTFQTANEATKFGLSAMRSQDGKLPAQASVVLTNYERLHYFSPHDFAGVVCDECFAAGTLIDTPDGQVPIERIRIGDRIRNASGVDMVSDVHRREVPYGVAVTVAGSRTIASPNHPWFTQRGWVGAQDIRPGDYVLGTEAAMRLVCEGVCGPVTRAICTKILRDVLLSEMANVSAGDLGEGSQPDRGREARTISREMVSFRTPESASRESANAEPESLCRSGDTRETLPPIERAGAQTFRAWGKWSPADRAAAALAGCAWTVMASGVCLLIGPQDSGIPDLLQARFGVSGTEARHRGGWSLPSLAKTSGREEGREVGFSRVDSVEILEQGHPDLERLRSPDGKLYFYDLGGTRHPSFSVSGSLVHNSSILKNFEGATRQAITDFMRKTPYRLLCTATAAPNDYIELGTSSEALGYLGYTDMLTKFFRNAQNTVKPMRYTGFGNPRGVPFGGEHTDKWRFKGHAELAFWRWVCSWARAIRKPSDMGFSDDGFVLPPLTETEHLVETKTKAPGMLFTMPAIGLAEQREERKRTVQERCEMAAALVTGTGKPAIVWCHLNAEGDLLESLIPDCVQVSGKNSDEEKEEAFLAFIRGDIRVLVTKPVVGAWGLNLQHCAHATFFPSNSFEQHYQAIRRCWRFGQKNPVHCDMITSEGEKGVLSNLQRKANMADQMFASLIKEMHQGMALERRAASATETERPAWL